FLLKDKPFGPVNIEVEFECDSKLYRYKISLTSAVVFHEELSSLDLDQKPQPERKRFKTLFSRSLDEATSEYQIKSHAEFSLSDGIREIIKRRRNASLLSAALFSNHEQSKPIKDYWTGVVTKIKQFGERSTPLDYQVFESTEFYYHNQKFKLSMEEIM